MSGTSSSSRFVTRGGGGEGGGAGEGVALARMTTVGIGGPARALARPATLDDLEHALAWAARAASCPSGAIGLGRTCLRTTTASRRSSFKLGGELAPVRGRGDLLVAGRRCGERSRPSPGAGGRPRRVRVRLCDPGSAGSGVWHERRPYGATRRGAPRSGRSAWTLTGARWPDADELALRYRHSDPRPRPGRRPGRIPARLHARLEEIKEPIGADAGPAQGRAADEQADVRQRVQESGATSWRGSDARGLWAARAIGSAPPRSRRATPTSSRTPLAQPLGTRWRSMSEARRRAFEEFGVELEHEVELPRRPRACRRREPPQAAAGRAIRGEPEADRGSHAPRGTPSTTLPPYGRSGRRCSVGLVLVGSRHRYGVLRCAPDRIFALDRIEVDGAPPATAKRIRAALERYVGESLVRFDRNDAARRLTSVADVAGARFDRIFRTPSRCGFGSSGRCSPAAWCRRVARLVDGARSPASSGVPTRGFRESGCRARPSAR